MDRYCTLCGFKTKTYSGLARHSIRCYTQHQIAYMEVPTEDTNVMPQNRRGERNVPVDDLSPVYDGHPAFEHMQHDSSIAHTHHATGGHIQASEPTSLLATETSAQSAHATADIQSGRKGPLSTSTQTREELFRSHSGRSAGEPIGSDVAAANPCVACKWGLYTRLTHVVSM
jgi:hypothetical protein